MTKFRSSKMKYKINIENRFGNMLSGVFDTRKDALRIIKKNKESDMKINKSGLRRESDGELIKINNKYSLRKVEND